MGPIHPVWVLAAVHSRWGNRFHTGAAMEETQCFNQTFRYGPFQRDCLTDKVGSFAEACGGQAIRIAIQSGILKSLTQGFGQVQNSEVLVARVWTGPKF